MHIRLARNADGGDGAAMITPITANDLDLIRTAFGSLIIPGKFDCSIISLGAGALKQYLGHRHWCQLDQFLCEINAAFMCRVAVRVVVAHFAHLVIGDTGDAFIGGEAQGGTP